MKNCVILLAVLPLFFKANAQTCTRPFHIVVLGSSTAAGDGASNLTKSWVYLYTEYLKSIDSNYVVDDLAVAGTTTYDAQPTDYTPPEDRPKPLQDHNISAAIRLKPDAIIINFPTNDAANNFSLTEQENNFKRITESAINHNILIWIATPQPRNNFTVQQVKRQNELYDWIMSYYGDKAIDFQTGFSSAADSILSKYDSGDGIHINDQGHKKLCNRVVKKSIPDSLCAVNTPIAENSMIKPNTTSEEAGF